MPECRASSIAVPAATAATSVAGIALNTLRDYLDVVPGEYTVVAVFVYESLGDFPEAGQHFVGCSRAVTVDVEEQDGEQKPVWRLHRP